MPSGSIPPQKKTHYDFHPIRSFSHWRIEVNLQVYGLGPMNLILWNEYVNPDNMARTFE